MRAMEGRAAAEGQISMPVSRVPGGPGGESAPGLEAEDDYLITFWGNEDPGPTLSYGTLRSNACSWFLLCH